MCGILGVLPSVDVVRFKGALDTLAHRGPNGYGIWEDSQREITLGHRRLAIIDLTDSGKQPMHFGNYVITFNGEIYNFLEIRHELKTKGYVFYTDSDTEVILMAFKEWGEKCLHKFNGMWAFAIWNRESKELFISRDRFGVKPLYYAFIGQKFVFASEMKALFSFLPEVRPSNNFDELKNNIFGYEHTEQCLVHGIKRFPAGSYAQLDLKSQKLRIHRFWNTKEHLVKVPVRYEEQVEQFRELFIDACKIRMRSDVPIGTALSGGLDSSATISTMAYIDKHNKDQRVAKDWQHAFVAAFPGTFLDETFYAQKVVDDINIPATYINIDPEKGIENMDHYLYLFEELYITSPVPMMETYKAIRDNGVVVSIDGHGADEMMSGYGHLPLNLLDCGANIFKIKNMLNTLQPLQDFDTVQLKKTTYNRAWYLGYMQQHLKGRKALGKYYVKSLLHRLPQERAEKAEFGHLNSALYEMFHETILPTLLRNYDRYSMASGVEIRMPFMDYRLVSFAFSLPWESKVKNAYSKSIIRDAMKGIVTDEVRLRKSKIGFNTPIVDWMKGAWKNYLMDMIHSRHFNESAMIDPAAVRNKVLQVIESPHALFAQGEQAWISLMPYLWEKNVIKNFKKYQA